MNGIMTAVTLLVALGAAAAPPVETRLELVRESLTGAHCRFRVLVEGVETDHYVTRPCTAATAMQPAIAPSRRRIAVGGRTAARTILEERPLERYAIDRDERTGEVLRRIPLFFNGKTAAVFDPNPVASLNAPSLQDQNDASAAVPPSAYRTVDLVRAADEGPLRGPHVAIVNRQAPDVAPADAAGSLTFDRQADGFEDVNAWYHIDRNQEYVRSLGYSGSRAIAPYSIEVDTHALGGADSSFFLPSLTLYGTGSLYFGEGGTDDAEDADLVIHEYGHALLEWIAPGTFGGSFASQPRAIAEGFCDYWAYSAHRGARIASGRDPFCLADWDARCWLDDPSQNCSYPPGTDCLRRVDGTRTLADYLNNDSAGTEHRNGSIWSSALREIHAALLSVHGEEEGRRVADTLILESFFGAPPAPGFAAMAQRLAEADRLLYSGAHASAICAAMSARGITGACETGPRGEATLFQADGRSVPIPDSDPAGVTSSLVISDARAIEAIRVRVDIEHPVRGDLRIELIAPDGTSIMLQQISVDRESDIHATFGLDTDPLQPLEALRGRSAAGTWRLRVTDLRLRDSGTLVSWGLLVRFAGEVPAATRPRAGRSTMIPVAAHLYGANDTTFRSDVRLANPSASAVRATLVFTPSGEDGTSAYSAIQVMLEPGRTVVLDDVVATLFNTAGSGSLEVLGDVMVMSRTYHRTASGSLGQQVPPVADTTAAGEPPLYLVGIRLPDLRTNLGLTETAGRPGTVRVEQGSTSVDVPILPFSHVQFPLTEPSARVTVAGGDARVAAYLSQIGTNGDAMSVPGERLRARTGIAPVASAPGVDGTYWRSDLWIAVPEPAAPFAMEIEYRTGSESIPIDSTAETQIDVVATTFERPGTVGVLAGNLARALVAHTRVTGAGTSQYVPFLEPEGPAVQHLLFVENGGGWRTNVGLVSAGAAVAEVVVFDASGAETERRLLGTDGGMAQLSVQAAVRGGRAEVRFVSGRGRAYASLVDERTRDATMVAGQ